MRIISRREFNQMLGKPGKPALVYHNPDDSVVIFEEKERARFDALIDKIGDDKPLIGVQSLTDILGSQEPEAKAEESPEVQPKKDDEAGGWKERALAKMSSNTANIQTVKQVMKEIIQRL